MRLAQAANPPFPPAGRTQAGLWFTTRMTIPVLRNIRSPQGRQLWQDELDENVPALTPLEDVLPPLQLMWLRSGPLLLS